MPPCFDPTPDAWESRLNPALVKLSLSIAAPQLHRILAWELASPPAGLCHCAALLACCCSFPSSLSPGLRIWMRTALSRSSSRPSPRRPPSTCAFSYSIPRSAPRCLNKSTIMASATEVANGGELHLKNRLSESRSPYVSLLAVAQSLIRRINPLIAV